MRCPACGSGIALLLGSLGRLTWFRCRDCGMDYSSAHTHELAEDIDE